MNIGDRVGPRRGRGRGRGFGPGSGPGSGPREPSMGSGMRPQMVRPNQPYDQYRPRPHFGQQHRPMNPSSNQPQMRGQFRMRGFNRPMKRMRDASNDREGIKRPRMKVPKEKTIQVIPMNSMACLNILHKNTDKTVKFRPITDNNTSCVIASLNFRDNLVHGYGATEEQAKRITAENALRSLVQCPDPDDRFPVNAVQNKDQDVWRSIISFSVYKLLSDWNEGRIGLQPRANWLASSGMIDTSGAVLLEDNTIADIKTSPLILSKKPAGKMPANPEKYHPSVLLNNLRPRAEYTKQELPDNRIRMTSTIDGVVFVGEDTSAKLARARLASKAIKELFNIDCKVPSK